MSVISSPALHTWSHYIIVKNTILYTSNLLRELSLTKNIAMVLGALTWLLLSYLDLHVHQINICTLNISQLVCQLYLNKAINIKSNSVNTPALLTQLGSQTTSLVFVSKGFCPLLLSFLLLLWVILLLSHLSCTVGVTESCLNMLLTSHTVFSSC